MAEFMRSMLRWMKREDSRTGPVGLLGKIPGEGDFVRIRAAVDIVGAFDSCLQSAIAKADGGHFPSTALRFIFRGAEHPRALVGCITGSEDAVGRKFPLAVFSPVGAATLSRTFPCVPGLFAEFFEEVEEVLEAARTSPLEELRPWIEELTAPEVEPGAVDGAVQAMLGTQRHGKSWDRLLGDGGIDARCYAIRTFMAACENARAAEGRGAGVALDCPSDSVTDVIFWMELARRLLQWRRVPPSMVWVEGASQRILIGLGESATAAVLPFLGSAAEVPRVWPLRTTKVEARQGARAALSAPQVEVLEREGVSNAELLTCLCGAEGENA